MGKECLAIRPILVLFDWELDEKVFDVMLLLCFELFMGFQSFSHSQLHERMHFKGSIYIDEEK